MKVGRVGEEMLQKGGEEPVRVPGGICHEGCEVVRVEGVGRWW